MLSYIINSIFLPHSMNGDSSFLKYSKPNKLGASPGNRKDQVLLREVDIQALRRNHHVAEKFLLWD